MTGNLAVKVGDKNYNLLMVGSTNLSVHVGHGGNKVVAIGDRNIIVHVGDAAATGQAVTIGGYRALEGLQAVVGTQNVVVNHGTSNDIIVAFDKTAQAPAIDSPFKPGSDGSTMPLAGFSVLRDIFGIGQGRDVKTKWRKVQKEIYKKPNQLLTLADSRSRQETSTALARDAQKKGKEQLGLDGIRKVVADTPKTGSFIVGGQGADIILCYGNINIVFGDTITSVLDTNIAALFDVDAQSLKLADVLGHNTESGDKRLAMATVGKWFETAGLTLEMALPSMTIGQVLNVRYAADGTPAYHDGSVGTHATGMLKVVSDLFGMKFKVPGLHVFGDAGGMAENLGQSIASCGSTAAGDLLSQTVLGDLLGFAQGDASSDTPSAPAPAPASAPDGRGGSSDPLPGLAQKLIPQEISKLPEIDKVVGLVTNFEEFASWIGGGGDSIKDRLTGMGFLQGDGDVVVSGGKLNLAWTGYGDDVVIQFGEWNRAFSGKGDDIGLQVGNYNSFSGGEGHDIAVLAGHNNLFFGDEKHHEKLDSYLYDAGHDMALAVGNKNFLSGGSGNDILMAIGDDNKIKGGKGQDFIVAVGNKNSIDSGAENDLIIAVGAENTYNTGGGTDTIINFGSVSQAFSGKGSDILKIAGRGSSQYGEAGDDLLIVADSADAATSSGGAGDDTMVVGGTATDVTGGDGADRFVVGADHGGSATIRDVGDDDWILLGAAGDDSDSSTWLEDFWLDRNGDDLVIQSGEQGTGKTTVSDYFSAGSSAKLVTNWWRHEPGAAPARDSDGPDLWTQSYSYQALDRQGVTRMIEAMSAVSADGTSPAAVQATRQAWRSTMIAGTGLKISHSAEYPA